MENNELLKIENLHVHFVSTEETVKALNGVDLKKAFISCRRGRNFSAENTAGFIAILSISIQPLTEKSISVTERESRMTAGKADIIIRITKIFQQRFISMVGKISVMKFWQTISTWRKRRLWNAA